MEAHGPQVQDEAVERARKISIAHNEVFAKALESSGGKPVKVFVEVLKSIKTETRIFFEGRHEVAYRQPYPRDVMVSLVVITPNEMVFSHDAFFLNMESYLEVKNALRNIPYSVDRSLLIFQPQSDVAVNEDAKL